MFVIILREIGGNATLCTVAQLFSSRHNVLRITTSILQFSLTVSVLIGFVVGAVALRAKLREDVLQQIVPADEHAAWGLVVSFGGFIT